ELEDMEPVKAKLDAIIEARLREAGFTTVPASEYAQVEKKMIELVGGYFDPISGKKDEAKYKRVQEHVRREISTKYEGHAVLRPAILRIGARFHGLTANLYVIQPDGPGPFPAVGVIQNQVGVADFTKQMTRRFAVWGY